MRLLPEHRRLFEKHAKQRASMLDYKRYCEEVVRGSRDELLSKHKGVNDARVRVTKSWKDLIPAVRASLDSEHASKITSAELRGFEDISKKGPLLELKQLCQAHGSFPRLRERFDAHHAAIDSLGEVEREARAHAALVMRLNRGEIENIVKQNWLGKPEDKKRGRPSPFDEARRKAKAPRSPGKPMTAEDERDWAEHSEEMRRREKESAAPEPALKVKKVEREKPPLPPKKERDDPEALRLLKKVPKDALKTASHTAYNMLHGHSDPRIAEQSAFQHTVLDIMRGSKLTPEQAKVLARHIVRKEKESSE